MAAPRMTRRFRVNQISVLKAEGKTLKEIAEITGLAYKTVRNYECDPGGSRQRGYDMKRKRPCAICGKPRSKNAQICQACRLEQIHANRVWTREAQIKSLQDFGARWGRPPVASDVLAYPGELPNRALIWREFGTWNNLLEAAGFPRRGRGGSKPRKAA